VTLLVLEYVSVTEAIGLLPVVEKPVIGTIAVGVAHWKSAEPMLVRFSEVISTTLEVVAPACVVLGLRTPGVPPPLPPPDRGTCANAARLIKNRRHFIGDPPGS
jgi:hypothetical protein